MRLKQSWEDGPERQGGRRRDRRPGTGPALWVFPRPGDALRDQVHLVAKPSGCGPGPEVEAHHPNARYRNGRQDGCPPGPRRQKGVHIPLASALLPPRALGHGCLHRGWAVTSDLREAVWHLLCHECWLASDHSMALKPRSPLLAALGVSLCQSTVCAGQRPGTRRCPSLLSLVALDFTRTIWRKPRHPGCGHPQCWRKTSVQGRAGGGVPGHTWETSVWGPSRNAGPQGTRHLGWTRDSPRKLGSRGAPCWPLDLRCREMTLGSEVGPLQGQVWVWCGHCRPHRERSNYVFLVFLALTRNLHKSSSPL